MSEADYIKKLNKLVKAKDGGGFEVDEAEMDKLEGVDEPLDTQIPATKKEAFGFSIKMNRARYTDFPDRLPTDGELPRPPDEHQRMGLYESKRDLYLLIANAYNKIMERLEALEDGQ